MSGKDKSGVKPAAGTSQDDGKDRVVIFDTTLRDGEQSPGASMNLEEKLQIADVLDEMGVDIIEAGFPIASQGDFESVMEIGKRVKKAVVCGLARAGFQDIDRVAEALKGAQRGRIHTFIGTSPVHRKYQLKLDEDEVYERVIASVTRARGYTDDVEWSPMDATRTEHGYLCRVVEAAITAGATTINIPDTVGYTTPEEFRGADGDADRAGAKFRQGRLPRSIVMTISVWRLPIRWPVLSAARGRSNAPSTARRACRQMRRWKRL